MSYQKTYTRELQKLYLVRTKWLRELVGIKSKGRKTTFNKKFIKKSVNRLSEVLIKLKSKEYFEKAIDEHTYDMRYFHKKGHGHKQKVEKFKEWYHDKIDYKYLIYIFWKKNRCLYIGRTGRGGSRPVNHVGTHRTHGWTRVSIYLARSNSYLPMLECLAWYHFDPLHNACRPSIPKWARKCPMLEDLKELKEEINVLF